MTLLNRLVLWSSTIGDVLWNSAQQAAVGSSFGNGAASFGSTLNPLQMGESGDLNVQIASAGVSPVGTANDSVLAVFQIPAKAFDQAARGVTIMACGNAPNTNARSLKIILNPTTAVVGSAVVGGTTIATVANGAAQAGASGGWQMTANLFKYGAAASNTQIAIHEAGQIGSFVTALTAPSLTTFNEANAITVAITGNATTAVADIVFNFLQITAMN